MPRALRSFPSAALLLCVCSWFIVATGTAAQACSCVAFDAAEVYGRAEAVYVARPRSFDVFPDASFQVTRVLKGPARSTVRLNVDRFTRIPFASFSSCAVNLHNIDYVLVRYPRDGFREMIMCGPHQSGTVAVQEAQALLGAGFPVAAGQDPFWLGQFAIPPVGIGVLVLRRRRRRRRRRLEVD